MEPSRLDAKAGLNWYGRRNTLLLGTFRLILALVVAVTHLPQIWPPVNPGVTSVICFYFISGYLMRKSYKRFLSLSEHPVRDFYIDRMIKLFPQYIIVVLLSFACLEFFGKPDAIPLLQQDFSIEKLALNLLLLPANYVFEPFVIGQLLPHPIVPPAWSLSTEFHFYLLLPLIFILRNRYWLLLLIASMSVQLSSLFFGSGVFNSYTFGYRFIFGALTIFMYGYAFARSDERFYRFVTIACWCIFLTFLLVIGPVFDILKNLLVKEILVGALIALPMTNWLLQNPPSGRLRKADRFLGDLAYPVFISHFFSYYVANKILGLSPGNHVEFFACSMVFCIAFSIALNQVQKMVERYRISRRGFASFKEAKSIAN